MPEILTWTVISALLFLVFAVTLLAGLFRKKRKLIITSLLTLVLIFASASWTIYLIASKSYDKVSDALAPRTGEEIYTALFGTPTPSCVKVLHFQDQNVPVLDYAIWLHFETCPNEVQRVLQQHDYNREKQSTDGWNSSGPLAGDDWFKPELMGDSVIVFIYKKDEYGNYQEIYLSVDSTEAYCKDVFD